MADLSSREQSVRGFELHQRQPVFSGKRFSQVYGVVLLHICILSTSTCMAHAVVTGSMRPACVTIIKSTPLHPYVYTMERLPCMCCMYEHMYTRTFVQVKCMHVWFDVYVYMWTCTRTHQVHQTVRVQQLNCGNQQFCTCINTGGQ